MEKRAAQPLLSPSRLRRPVHKMFKTTGAGPDFYAPEPVEKAKQKWFSASSAYPQHDQSYQQTKERIARDSMMRQQLQRQRLQPQQMPMSGTESGYGQSHTPVYGTQHPLVFSEEQGQDLNFQANQQAGNPWFNPHQQATRFAETFGAESIRKKQDPSPFGR
jgi:hypothetical protein